MISKKTLSRYYSDNKIKYRSVDLNNVMKIRQTDRIIAEQRDFVMDIEIAKVTKVVYWLDETSLSLWSSLKRKTWTDGSITLPMPKTAFQCRTVIGVIGGDDLGLDFFYRVIPNSKKEYIWTFLVRFIHHCNVPRKNILLVLDNHGSHKSHMVTEFLQDQGVEYLYLPPYSSTLNPIERVWSCWKH